MRLFSLKDGERVETVLKYIEDGDLRRWSLPDSKAFNIGICEWRSKLNCILNPHMYEQVQVMPSHFALHAPPLTINYQSYSFSYSFTVVILLVYCINFYAVFTQLAQENLT